MEFKNVALFVYHCLPQTLNLLSELHTTIESWFESAHDFRLLDN